MLNLSYHKRSIIELGRKGEDLGSLEEAKEGLDSLQEENESLADKTKMWSERAADNLKTEVSKLKEDMKTQSKDLQAKFTADLIAAGPKLSDKVVEATAILRKEYDVKKTKAKAKHAAALQEARKSIIEESAKAIEDLKKELSTEAKET
ncbi:hypothetical protein V498_00606 [Pseudogymnoascus sp. VKM F-4517 (FW-2822)]|nr:hypothetical protein V498_00606 [Pseudogymnoascus sp. VKM F-4517 (FW-2822)]